MECKRKTEEESGRKKMSGSAFRIPDERLDGLMRPHSAGIPNDVTTSYAY